MLEVRYNGCPDCLSSAKALLRKIGMFSGRDYKVVYHKDHKDEAIYSARPDYLKIFSGCIFYNPDTQSWIDMYNNDHTKCVICNMKEDDLRESINTLLE